jgi:hypothetical protein
LKFTQVRFESSKNEKSQDSKETSNNSNNDSNLPINRSENFHELTEKFNPDLSSKVSKPSASLPGMDPSLKALMTKPKTHYNPTLNTQQESYEFNAPKSPKQLYKEKMQEKARPKSKIRKMLPSLIICGGLCWAIFTYKYLTKNSDPKNDNDSALLRDDKFLTYLISFKHQINDDHYLIELTRKNRAEKLIHNEQLFNGDKLWSIEIMQPDINIVRNYTPLPMYVAGINPNTKEPHLRLVKELEEEGKFIIIVKKYNDGEFSRWLTNRNLLDEIKIRGPIIEYKFPFHPLNKYDERPQMSNTLSTIKPDPIWPENLPKPENYSFFGAGTGILPLFQLIYSPNPPRGFIDVWYSLKDESELLPQIKTLNFFAEKCGRVKFHYLISNETNHQHLTSDKISSPTLPNFTGGLDLRISEEVYKQKLLREKKLEIQKQIGNTTSLNKETTMKEANDNDKDFVILDSSSNDKAVIENIIKPIDLKIKADNAYQQWTFFKKSKDPKSLTLPTSFTFICGPDSYIADISGKPDLNNLEKKDNGPIGGLLKEKGWDLKNIKRLQ